VMFPQKPSLLETVLPNQLGSVTGSRIRKMNISRAPRSARPGLSRLIAFGSALLTLLSWTAGQSAPPARPTTHLTEPHSAVVSTVPSQSPVLETAPVGPDPGPGRVRLPGHIPASLLKRATALPTQADPGLMTLTMTLRRDDEAGFQRYLRDVYAPGSSTFRQFLTQPQLTRRFGPSSAAYEEVRAYLRTQGFQVVSGSRNHLTITVRGTRAQVESTFALHIRELEANGTRVFVNDADPAVPEALAPHLQAVVGLMSQPIPRPAQ